MKVFRLRSTTATLLAATIVISAMVAVTPPALAQDDGDDTANAIGGILGAIIGAAMIDKAHKAWNAVDSDVRECLIQRYNISPTNLANQAIGPNDSRIADYVNSCYTTVSNIREQQRQAEARRRAEIAAEEERQRIRRQEAEEAERQRLAAIAAAEAERRAEEAAAEARRAARHKALTAKYGDAVAVAVENHRVETGMSKQAVLESCGRPDGTEKVPPDVELWSYGSMRVVFRGNLVTRVER